MAAADTAQLLLGDQEEEKKDEEKIDLRFEDVSMDFDNIYLQSKAVLPASEPSEAGGLVPSSEN